MNGSCREDNNKGAIQKPVAAAAKPAGWTIIR